MNDAILTVVSKALAFGDASSGSNPKLRHFDWTRTQEGIQVQNPKSDLYVIEAGAEKTIFDGSRSTGIDGTTTFSVTLNPVDANAYRFTHSGGTAPAFRTDRALTLSGKTVTVVVNANATATMSLSAGTWAGVQVGDTLFIPGTTTGDSVSPFNALNVGYWTVLNVDGANLMVMRPVGQDFEGADEAVLIASNPQVQAFSAAGLKVGDKMDVTAGFVAGTRKSYIVTAVNPKWVEVGSTSPLALEVNIAPGAAGMTFYAEAKRFLRVEVDQEAAVRLNGDAGSTVRVSPVVPADSEHPGWFEKYGLTWGLKVVNLSSSPLSVLILSAE